MAGHTYRFLTSRPLFAFGFGLGYSDIRVLSAKTVFGGVLVKLRNEGGRDGVQTVQMYVRKPDDKDAPLKTLRAFKRVGVPAGRSRWIFIPLTDKTFEWWSETDGRMRVLEGNYELMIGTSSSDEVLSVLEYSFS